MYFMVINIFQLFHSLTFSYSDNEDGNLSDKSIRAQIRYLNHHFEGHFKFELVKVLMLRNDSQDN